MKKTININGKLICLESPKIMGVINVTPDSYYKDSRINPFEEEFIKKAKSMIENGADIIDIGGYSSRPGADFVSEEIELKRVLPAIKKLRKQFSELLISVDTFRAKVAGEAVCEGANIINDISAGDLDPMMHETVKKLGVPYIMMHTRSDPKNMLNLTNYEDFIPELVAELFKKINKLKKNGIKDIIIDPGFGFAKTMEQNYYLLKNLNIFNNFDMPVLIGLSRKSMIYKALNITPEDALVPSTQLNFYSLLQNVKIIRVHDAKEAKETINLIKLLNLKA